jgi:chromosome segregation ATPase
MRSVVALGLVSLLAIAAGCQDLHKENERLLTERNSIQSQYETEKAAKEASMSKAAELDKQLAQAKAENDKLRQDLDAARAAGTQQMNDAQAAANKRVEALQAALDKQAKDASEQNSKLAAQLAEAQAATTAAKNSASAGSAALSAKVAELDAKVEQLTKENQALKAAKSNSPTTLPAKD